MEQDIINEKWEEVAGMPEETLSLKEAAVILGMSAAQTKQAVSDGLLGCYSSGYDLKFTRKSLKSYKYRRDMYTEQEIIRRGLPTSSIRLMGIYFLIKDGRVTYVGQSKNIHQRICEHMKTKDFSSFYYIETEEGDLSMLEAFYIHKLEPGINKHLPDVEKFEE